MGEPASPVVLDATVLSNYASTDSIEVLPSILPSPTATETVAAEITDGLNTGYEFLEPATRALGTTITVVSIPDAAEDALIEKRLDAGEASSLQVAIESSGTLATDDLDARRIAERFNVPVTGSIGLLVRAVDRELLTIDSANEMLRTWRVERGYHAPVDRIDELLEDRS